jgi:hypothetical protein
MNSSNGVCHITEIEARLGDILRRSFPGEGLDRDPKVEFDEWAARNNIQRVSFWDYTPTKRKSPELHLVPTPHPGLVSSDTFLVFDDEMAAKVLFLGQVPKG